jgi:hypothetical protein
MHRYKRFALTVCLWFGASLMSGIIGMAAPAFSQNAALVSELDQGWDNGRRDAWYGATQGSRLIPLDWLKALEQPGNNLPFLQPDHIAKFRYLPRKNAGGDVLPVGFAIDTGPDQNLKRTALRWKAGQGASERWVGMTCSACHTTELTFNGKTIRVEGGPGLGDFQSFIAALNSALKETSSDAGKWDRFAKGVLRGSADNAKNRDLLKSAFGQLLNWQEREAEINKTDLQYGYGRVDALGHIFNKVALLVDPAQTKPNPADAPVSIPFIWRAPQLDKVQYNGIASKYTLLGVDLGALARNTGEVIGVLGDVKVGAVQTLKDKVSGFESSVKVQALMRLEDQLKSLRPPKWPVSVLAAFNGSLVKDGEGLYNTHCSSCHIVIDRTNLNDPIQVQMSLFDGSSRSNVTGKPVSPPGTDAWMACNAYDYSAPSGILEAAPSAYFKGDPIGKTQHISDLLTVTVVGTILGKKGEVSAEAAAAFFRGPRPPALEELAPVLPPNARRSPGKTAQLQRCLSWTSPILGYTSRPLNGIWATAPYLHNGSVPTLYDLLLPPAERPGKFYVGTREFDAKNVGYRTDKDAPGNSFLYETHDADGNEIDGNSNAGHDYANEKFTPQQRRAIVEFLKTL